MVLTKSIPFSIENQNINLEQLIKLRKLKQEQKAVEHITSADSTATNDLFADDEHIDLFEELAAILGESDKT